MLIACIGAIASHAAEFRTEKFLESLAMKETGLRWDGKPGPCGELSKWQILEMVWIEEMPGVPFSEARNEDVARVCVLRHIERLCASIRAAHIKPTAERIATCWHYGASHRRHASVWGTEVQNLYDAP